MNVTQSSEFPDGITRGQAPFGVNFLITGTTILQNRGKIKEKGFKCRVVQQNA